MKRHDASAKGKMWRGWIRWVLLAAGLFLFAWFVKRAGPAEIAQMMARLGWAAPLVLLPYALVYVLDTLGWFIAFGKYATQRLPYTTLFRVRWAGESVNYVVPSAYIGGEAVKAWLLHKRGVSGLTGGTSVVASKTCQTLAQVIFIALGALLALPHLAPGSGARTGVWIISVAAWGVVGLLFVVQRIGLFTAVTALARRLPVKVGVLETHRDQLRELDRQIYGFYHGDPLRFFGSTLAYLTGWIADSLEIMLVCWLFGEPVAWSEAVAIEAFIGVAKALGMFVPGALGVQESGVALLFQLFGLSPAMGAAYALIRRGREVVFAVAGGFILSAEGPSWRSLWKRAKEGSVGE